MKRGDVVIASQVVDLYYERLWKKGQFEAERRRSKGQKPRGEGIQLDDQTVLEVRVDSLPENVGLKDIASKTIQWIERSPGDWKDLVRKYVTLSRPKFPGQADEQEAKIVEDFLSSIPTVVYDRVFSSDHNVNDPEFRNELISRYKVQAFEMEGGGLGRTAQRLNRLHIDLRGISDMCDGKRDHDSTFQWLASSSAAACWEVMVPFLAEWMESRPR